MTMRFASLRSPTVTGSNNEAMDTFPSSGKDWASGKGRFQEGLKIGKGFDEGGYRPFVALVETPLPDAVGRDQPRFGQYGQMGGNGRLGEAAPFELARAHAHLQRHVLAGEMI